MSILDFLNLSNKSHLKAISELIKTGCWPKMFYSKLPGDMSFPPNWQVSLAFKLAEKYLVSRGIE